MSTEKQSAVNHLLTEASMDGNGIVVLKTTPKCLTENRGSVDETESSQKPNPAIPNTVLA